MPPPFRVPPPARDDVAPAGYGIPGINRIKKQLSFAPIHQARMHRGNDGRCWPAGRAVVGMALALALIISGCTDEDAPKPVNALLSLQVFCERNMTDGNAFATFKVDVSTRPSWTIVYWLSGTRIASNSDWQTSIVVH